MKTITHSGQVCTVTDDTWPGMFRELDPAEVIEFEEAADQEAEEIQVASIWHPIYQSRLFEKRKGHE